MSAAIGTASKPGARKGGRVANRNDWRMVREIFVADTDEEAWRLSVGGMMGRMMGEYFLPLLSTFGFKEYLKHHPDVPDSDVTVEYCAKHNWLIGSPKTVAEKLEKIYEDVGGFGQLLRLRLRLPREPGRLAQLAAADPGGGDAAGEASGAEGAGVGAGRRAIGRR